MDRKERKLRKFIRKEAKNILKEDRSERIEIRDLPEDIHDAIANANILRDINNIKKVVKKEYVYEIHLSTSLSRLPFRGDLEVLRKYINKRRAIAINNIGSNDVYIEISGKV